MTNENKANWRKSFTEYKDEILVATSVVNLLLMIIALVYQLLTFYGRSSSK